MLGRKASLKALRTALYRHRPTALRTTEFAQGVWPVVAFLHHCFEPLLTCLSSD